MTSVSYQTKTDLPAAEVADDDMIWVTQKKQQLKCFCQYLSSEISWRRVGHITNKGKLTCCRVIDDGMIWVTQKSNELKWCC